MTVVYYKVGNSFTKSYNEMKQLVDTLKEETVRLLYERPHIDDIDILRKIEMDSLIKAYEEKEVHIC